MGLTADEAEVLQGGSRREQEGMGLKRWTLTKADDLAVIIDPPRLRERPTGAGLDEIVQVRHRSAAIKKAMDGLLVAADYSNDLALVVDGVGLDVCQEASKIAQIGHRAASIKETARNGWAARVDAAGYAHDLAMVIKGQRLDRREAAETPERSHESAVIHETEVGEAAAIGVGFTDDLALIVDAVREACGAAQSAQIGQGATVVKESVRACRDGTNLRPGRCHRSHGPWIDHWGAVCRDQSFALDRKEMRGSCRCQYRTSQQSARGC